MKHQIMTALCALSLLVTSCKDQEGDSSSDNNEEKTSNIKKPSFNADSAYAYIQTQVDFGPRVPGTPQHLSCAAWMQQKLNAFCDTVYRQETRVKAGDGRILPCINLVGAINPAAERRVLLMAHWDTRPWADMDTVDKDKPMLGADDAASGVAVLLEIARQIQTQPLPADLGVDILLVDVEDFGKSEWGDESYALGTQHWARNPHIPGYKAEFGILLDMVGSRNARFPLETNSTRYAGSYQQMIWQAANRAGYSSYFPFVAGNEITDDHVFVNLIAKIPTVDIINLTMGTNTSFGAYWHTHNDNMSIIDKNTLMAVGATVLQVIYETAQPV